MASSLIGLGSNVGDRQQTLDHALELLDRHPGVRVAARSSWRETAPIGGPPGQKPFLNGAALLETTLEPVGLIATLLEIEAQLGRKRGQRWGPRTLDLDLLLFDQRRIDTPQLVVPHPRMAWRRFVLEPAAEIAPSMIHPIIGWTIARLLDHLNTAVSYIALAGPAAVGKGSLARRLVDARNQHRPHGARLIADPVHRLPGQGRQADWPSNALQREVQFLKERARPLIADLPDWRPPGGLAISDYWLDQSLAYAEASLDADEYASLRRLWEDLAASVVPPKLLVVLDPPNDQLGQAIANLARQPGRGPVLSLEDPDLDLAADEVLAAIDAME
jgi:2-amino-4-hydroxy-6-hydroxymethyldihydropteridine diphosphokinase